MTAVRDIAIVGIGSTEVVRKSDLSLGNFAVRAALAAVEDAGLSLAQIDGYVGSPGAPNPSAVNADGLDEVSHQYMLDVLGLNGVTWAMDVSGMPTGMVVAGAQALAAGACNYVLGVRAHYNPVDRKYSETGKGLAGGRDQFVLPYGHGPGGTRFALWLQRYMHETGATREDLFQIVALARANARCNPLAVWRDAPDLGLDDYLSARWINEPMCLFDSDIPVTAAGAFVMTTAERARDLRQKPAWVASYANATEPGRVFSSLGLCPGDIQVAQLYDGYSPIVWNTLEMLGFCGRGEAHAFATLDRLGQGGALPVNTFGGSLGEGRIHGMGHLREAVLQAMGRAGPRQVPDVRFSLVHVGVLERFWTVLLSSERPE